jgi:DNA repair photolyase
LNKTGIPGYDYCMNPYGGCTHGCIYCYASFICRFRDHDEKWGEFLEVKVNFPAALAKQLRTRRMQRKGKVLLGTVTDVYQPAEARFGITRSSLEVLADSPQLEVHILTKSDLVQRDIPILKRLRVCEAGFTITTMERKVSGMLEPGASPPNLRLAAAGELMKAGIAVWVFIAPLLPGLTDTEESLGTTIQAIRESGIRNIQLDKLNPYPGVIGRLKRFYGLYFPGALPGLEEYLYHPGIYRDTIARRLRKLKPPVSAFGI